MLSVKDGEHGLTLAETAVVVAVLFAAAAGIAMFIFSRESSSEQDRMLADLRDVYSFTTSTVDQAGVQVHTGVAPAYHGTPYEGYGVLEPAYDLVVVGGMSSQTLCVDAYSSSGLVMFKNADEEGVGSCASIGSDDDGDGFATSYEVLTGSDPADRESTPWTDDDGDGFANIVEIDSRTNPFSAVDAPLATPGDMDGDNYADDLEIASLSDPLDSRSIPGDIDGNGEFDAADAVLSGDADHAGSAASGADNSLR